MRSNHQSVDQWERGSTFLHLFWCFCWKVDCNKECFLVGSSMNAVSRCVAHCETGCNCNRFYWGLLGTRFWCQSIVLLKGRLLYKLRKKNMQHIKKRNKKKQYEVKLDHCYTLVTLSFPFPPPLPFLVGPHSQDLSGSKIGQQYNSIKHHPVGNSICLCCTNPTI